MEGAAWRGMAEGTADQAEVVHAVGSGDDLLAALAADADDPVLLVSADRGLPARAGPASPPLGTHRARADRPLLGVTAAERRRAHSENLGRGDVGSGGTGGGVGGADGRAGATIFRAGSAGAGCGQTTQARPSPVNPPTAIPSTVKIAPASQCWPASRSNE